MLVIEELRTPSLPKEVVIRNQMDKLVDNGKFQTIKCNFNWTKKKKYDIILAKHCCGMTQCTRSHDPVLDSYYIMALFCRFFFFSQFPLIIIVGLGRVGQSTRRMKPLHFISPKPLLELVLSEESAFLMLFRIYELADGRDWLVPPWLKGGSNSMPFGPPKRAKLCGFPFSDDPFDPELLRYSFLF